MVGGKVGTTTGLTLDGGKRVRLVCCYDTRLNLVRIPYTEVTCVFMEDNEVSQLIRTHDSVWWQAGTCYWTPLEVTRLGGLPRDILKLGSYDSITDSWYDIPIKKIGGSF